MAADARDVQMVVDADHHLIVTHTVTNVGVDRRQLGPMAIKAKSVLGAAAEERIKIIADKGFYRGEDLVACTEANIGAYVAKIDTSGKRGKGECPASERAIYRYARDEAGKNIRSYWSSACIGCPLKSKCTPGKYRRIRRWEHEAVVATARLVSFPEAMRIRRATVEHPFGTLTHWMESTHFLMKTRRNVSTEMSRHVLAYNMKRVISLVGAKAAIEAI